MLLSAVNVSKVYQKNNKDFYAVKDADFTIDKGEFVIIEGRSGSGKSTLLNIFTGLIKPSFGQVVYEERNICGFGDKDISYFRNAKLGYVMQGNGLLSNLNVIENVCFPAYLFDKEACPLEKACRLLKKVGMYEHIYEYPRNLSGGELKRVEIARALINSPSILVADEPTGNLDIKNTHEIMELFKEIAESGTAVVVVTHDKECLSYADKILTMSEGRLEIAD